MSFAREPRDPRDPFETLVELTAAAVRGRPPREFVYDPLAHGPSLLQRLGDLLGRVRHPLVADAAIAANEPDIHDSKLLQRYY